MTSLLSRIKVTAVSAVAMLLPVSQAYAQQWQQMPGAAKAIAAAGDKGAVLVGTDGAFYVSGAAGSWDRLTPTPGWPTPNAVSITSYDGLRWGVVDADGKYWSVAQNFSPVGPALPTYNATLSPSCDFGPINVASGRGSSFFATKKGDASNTVYQSLGGCGSSPGWTSYGATSSAMSVPAGAAGAAQRPVLWIETLRAAYGCVSRGLCLIAGGAAAPSGVRLLAAGKNTVWVVTSQGNGQDQLAKYTLGSPAWNNGTWETKVLPSGVTNLLGISVSETDAVWLIDSQKRIWKMAP